MSYDFISTGETVVLNVIANASESITNLRKDGCRIMKMPVEEYFYVCQKIGYNHSYKDLFSCFVHNNALIEQCDKPQNASIIVFESKTDPFDPLYFLDVLKFYKSLDIFSCHSVNYTCKNNIVRFGGIGNIFSIIPERAFVFSERYFLNDEEITVFPEWYASHLTMLSKQGTNSIFANAVHLYIKSFALPDISASFLMLMIILEMVFCSENIELSYRIKRGCSYFLSHGRMEMEVFLHKIGSLYNVRSKYVHTGEQVKMQQLFELREITREVLVTMFEHKMHTKDFNFKKFRDELTYCGYSN